MMHLITQNRVAASRILALGVLLAALLAAYLLLAAKPAHAATTFTVNSTGDKNDRDFPGGVFDGSSAGKCFTGEVMVVQGKECTLRAAIQEANDTPGADTIDFAIPTTGVATIAPASQLPTITRPVSINGYSQPGAKPNTLAVGNDAVLKIELDGEGAGSDTHGLEIRAPNSVVRGLVINRFTHDGIHIEGPGNKVEGNFIGTDPSSTMDLGNFNGVRTQVGGDRNTVGGNSPDAHNVISGNDEDGVQIDNGEGNKVLGNLIGTEKDGKSALGNGASGVEVQTRGNTVGGDAAARNTIAFNGADGVSVISDTSKANRVLSNSVFANAYLGIDLGGDGVTANDGAGDRDTGPNNLQNFPVLSSARTEDGKTTIKGSLNSTPNKTFRVQFFKNPSGTDEGKNLIGQKLLTTGAGGNVTLTFSPAQKVRVGRTVTATATNPGGNTSEFSARRKVVAK